MKDEKKVKATEEEAKKEVQTEEEGVELNEKELEQVAGGTWWFWNKDNNSKKTYWYEKL